MKIWTVTFNDGGWHSGSPPSYQVVAESKEEAIQKVLEKNPRYKSGYYEKTYTREKNLEKLDI